MFRRPAWEAAGGFRTEDGHSFDKAFLVRVALAQPIDILDEPLIRYRRHAAQVSASAEWEQDQRKKSARLQLWAASQLGLAPWDWIFPLSGWLYASLPVSLRPRSLKDAVKMRLLHLLNVY